MTSTAENTIAKHTL